MTVSQFLKLNVGDDIRITISSFDIKSSVVAKYRVESGDHNSGFSLKKYHPAYGEAKHIPEFYDTEADIKLLDFLIQIGWKKEL